MTLTAEPVGRSLVRISGNTGLHAEIGSTGLLSVSCVETVDHVRSFHLALGRVLDELAEAAAATEAKT